MTFKILDRMEIKTPELSIAPLIDCVFLLLVFFMVTTTFTRETGVVVKKPKAATSDVLAHENMLIGVTEDGAIWYDNRRYDLPGIRRKVEEQIDERPETNVVIVADKESRTRHLVDVLDECKLAGAKKLSLASMVEKKDE